MEITVPCGTEPSLLITVFSSTGVSVAVDGVEQISGYTANDFTAPVNYTVTAEGGCTFDFVVRVIVEIGFGSFKFLEEDNSELDKDLEGGIEPDWVD